jgi:protein-disulfide isomerase
MSLNHAVIVLSFLGVLDPIGCQPSHKSSSTSATTPPLPSVAVVKPNVDSNSAEAQIAVLRKELAAMRSDIRALRTGMNKVLVAIGEDPSTSAKKAAMPVSNKKYDIAVGSSPVLGPANAPVTIVEFIDFQCPYCVKEYPKIKEVTQQYPDKVKVVFKNYPLEFHKQAKPAHAAAELARLQGGSEQFWKMHDMITASPTKLDIPTLRGYAQSLNMDMAKFNEVMADPNKMNVLLSVDLAEAKKCDVHGTPTVFINGFQLADRSIEGYKSRINNILTGQKQRLGN